MKLICTHFFIDLLVTIGDIKPFLRNIDDQSMVVLLNMLFLKYYHAKKSLI